MEGTVQLESRQVSLRKDLPKQRFVPTAPKGVVQNRKMIHNKERIEYHSNVLYYNDELMKQILDCQLLTEKERKFVLKWPDRLMFIPSKIFFAWVSDSQKQYQDAKSANISLDLLRAVLTTDKVKMVKDILTKSGVVTCDFKKKLFRKSFGYFLAEKFYTKSQWRQVKSGQIRYPVFKNPNIGVARQMGTLCAEKVTIDEKKWQKTVSSHENNQKPRWVDNVNYAYRTIKSKESYFKIDPRSGRIYSVFSNLPRALRGSLLIDGEATTEIDVVSCQPLLMTTLYKSITEERSKYRDLVQNGEFYEYIQKITGIKKRDVSKRATYAYFFGKNGYFRNQKFVKAFIDEFPELENAMWEFKAFNRYNELAIHMQQLEAEIMISYVAKKALELGITVITIHDSIMVKESDKERIKSLILDGFRDRVGLVPKLKEKNYKNSGKTASEIKRERLKELYAEEENECM